MSGLTLKCSNSAENEFFAEETLINIVSGIEHPKMMFLSGVFGPFSGGIPCEVPLWLAIQLRKQGKCTIEIPQWMTVESLEESLKNERVSDRLTDLPFYYVEIAQLLLNNAKDDITSPDKVAVLLQDLENIRMDRIKTGVLGIAEAINEGNSVVSAALANVSSVEIYSIKRFFLTTMNTFYWMSPPDNDANDAAQQEQRESVAGSSKKKLRRKEQQN